MHTPELIAYIKQQLAVGVTRADVSAALSASGWAQADINAAFEIVAPAPVSPQPSLPSLSREAAPVITMAPASSHPRMRTLLIASAFIVLAGGAVAYAYAQKIGPFAQLPYAADNLLSGILETSGTITSSSYRISAALATGPRDEGAVPFAVQVSNGAQLNEQYQHDARRASDVRTLLQLLSFQGRPYPATLRQAVNAASARNQYYYQNVALADPVTGKPYDYAVTAGGSDFTLTATFESTGALQTIRRAYGYTASSTIIRGKMVTFTKESSAYFYIPSEPPKPLFVQLSEAMRFLSPDVSGSLSVSAATDWRTTDAASWKFNVSAAGDFGDLSFKVDADALKKDTSYYFRINNMPSLFGDLSSIKGQWVKVDSAASTTASNSWNQFQYVAARLPEAEKSYKENRAQAAAALRRLAEFADSVHLLIFKGAPHSEKVDGRLLYRYDLEANKEAILPFYTQVAEEANTNDSLRGLSLFDDPGMVEYLRSDEFAQVFDYFNKNTSLTLWVDPQGYPAKLVFTMRVVPPDTATQLAAKQVNLTWELGLSDINEFVDITPPSDAKPIQELVSALDKNISYSLDSARTKGNDAAIKSNLSTIQVQAELFYGGTGGNSYGSQTWRTGAASSCTGGMYKDAAAAKALAAADTANGEGKGVACYANGSSYLVGAELASSGWWCVDSMGTSRAEFGSFPAKVPSGSLCP